MKSNPNPNPNRRDWLAGAASVAALAAAPLFVRDARAADSERFALGIASGQPRPDGMVLWTRLTGDALPARVAVRWELAHDEAFTRIAARGEETAIADEAHSVHAEPLGLDAARVYWYRFEALGQRSASGRTRTAPAADAAVAQLEFAVASCQRFDHGHFAAWRDVVRGEPDLILFVGDYIYEAPALVAKAAGAGVGNPRQHEGGLVRTLADYRARYAQYKRDPALQAAHAAAPWLLVWDDHEVDNDYAGLQGQNLQADFEAQRAAAYQAYWEHMPFPKSARPRGAEMRIVGRLDWGRLARIHLLDDRQYRDPQACPRPGKGGSNTVRSSECAALRDPRRTLLGDAQERWLADGWDLNRPWNLLAQQTLMARFAWDDPARDARYWTDGWDGYPVARSRLLNTVAEKQVPGVVVLGGDVHTHYVADLKRDFDDAASPIVATEFCGTSIASHSLAQERIDAALKFNPHIKHGRGDKRGSLRISLDAKQLTAQLRVVDDAADPQSTARTSASFVVDARRPGAVAG